MALHFTLEEHDAHPPASWVVVRTDSRWWQLLHSAADGYPLGTYRTKRAAEAAKVSGFWVDLYEKEGRWFRGETVPGWKPCAAPA